MKEEGTEGDDKTRREEGHTVKRQGKKRIWWKNVGSQRGRAFGIDRWKVVEGGRKETK